MHLYHPHLHHVTVQITQHCDACQCQKLPGPQYSHLPPHEAALLPWEEVALDLVGPWTVTTVGQESHNFYALTWIDPVTHFPDTIRLSNNTDMVISLFSSSALYGVDYNGKRAREEIDVFAWD
jgi:hypothetical protein